MQPDDLTSWATIRAAGAGEASARARFAERYAPIVRRLLRQRWQRSKRLEALEDAAQEVFLECFKEAGALQAVDESDGPGFRVYLGAIVRNVARRYETRAAFDWAHRTSLSGALRAQSAVSVTVSQTLDRSWALGIVRAAAEELRRRAPERGGAALLRADLLELRFGKGLPIRDIARIWRVDAAYVHHQYAKAREDFLQVLHEVLRGRTAGGAAHAGVQVHELLALLA